MVKSLHPRESVLYTTLQVSFAKRLCIYFEYRKIFHDIPSRYVQMAGFIILADSFFSSAIYHLQTNGHLAHAFPFCSYSKHASVAHETSWLCFIMCLAFGICRNCTLTILLNLCIGFLDEILDVTFKLWSLKWKVSIAFFPFALVLLAFVAFVIWNGSIVLGTS